MKPIGPLMKEHRVIEKMIALVGKELAYAEAKGDLHPRFLDAAVDFIRVYADRTHHGKEEDILFDELSRLDLPADQKKTMDDLVDEHRKARQTVKELVQAKEAYVNGDEQALRQVIDKLKILVEMYPSHIAKEDDAFFPAAMEQLSQEEQDDMLRRCNEFDQMMIHEKYRNVVSQWEAEYPA